MGALYAYTTGRAGSRTLTLDRLPWRSMTEGGECLGRRRSEERGRRGERRRILWQSESGGSQTASAEEWWGRGCGAWCRAAADAVLVVAPRTARSARSHWRAQTRPSQSLLTAVTRRVLPRGPRARRSSRVPLPLCIHLSFCQSQHDSHSAGRYRPSSVRPSLGHVVFRCDNKRGNDASGTRSL